MIERSKPLDRCIAAALTAALAVTLTTIGLIVGDLLVMDTRLGGLAVMAAAAVAGLAVMRASLRALGRPLLSPWLLLPLTPYALMVLARDWTFEA